MARLKLMAPAAKAHPIIHVLHTFIMAAGRSHASVVREAKIGRTTLDCWYSGERDPTFSKLERVFKLLGYDLIAQKKEKKP